MPYPHRRPDVGNAFTQTAHHDTYPAIDSATKSDHTGHYVFITGASKGVGRATAISFAKAGAAGIAIGARSGLDEVESEIVAAAQAAGKTPPKVLKLKLDVLKLEDVQNAAKATEKEFGRVDILINNAGWLDRFIKLEESDPHEYWLNYEVNIRGVYWMTKEFLPLLLESKQKTIVNLSSIGAHVIAYGASGYQTTKFALMRFTEHLMVEYGEQGLLAYGIHPGGIPTELANRMPEQISQTLGDTPELAADTMTFLTAKRIEWLAGRYVSANWDVPELLSKKDEIVNEDKLVFRMKF
ncbi:hypothetical protein F5884DRAFT_793056 [Xylogone sp. PMI_703]|nr:hypothetical protein F5884DRAFT_793056 [Xylogone sp. PMI_703]